MPSTSPEISLEPRVLEWARNRVGLTEQELAKKARTKLDRVLGWEQDGAISISEAGRVAKATYTPVGYLYLSAPPVERLSVADFRSIGDEMPASPSPNLLAVLDDERRRQDWYRDYLVSIGAEPIDFVGSLTEDTPIETAAARIRERHGLTVERRADAQSNRSALSLEIGQIEAAGVLVMRSGIVGSNTRRRLDVGEFRGFTLSDEYAPIIFINSRDAQAAQLFTLMHELVHVWLGQSGVSNVDQTAPITNHSERFCNAVAAEILVPGRTLAAEWNSLRDRNDRVVALARRYKVSDLVVLRRLFDAGILEWADFRARYQAAEAAQRGRAARSGSGGDFYITQGARLGKPFQRAVIESTLEGRTSTRDALPLLGVKKLATFHEMARRLGFPA
ncbi:MAG TPA: ImmA/IrrE family metallo-endopeptidase [Patescibacteria group bacterium]|nr:ImmA/IrrE family metallo-endopeptidase [Patescibacteria group bacterium]